LSTDFQAFLDEMPGQRMKNIGSESVNKVVTHYYDVNDERQIQGVKSSEDIYKTATAEGDLTIKGTMNIKEISEDSIIPEEGKEPDNGINIIFGNKVALCLISNNSKFKEVALKYIQKHLTRVIQEGEHDFTDILKSSTHAISETILSKVHKVFTCSLSLFCQITSSQQIEDKGIDNFIRLISLQEYDIIPKLLKKIEEGNLRVTAKINETLFDLAFHSGEGFIVSYIIERIQHHNRMFKQSNP
jgi:hypothetical protein